MSLSLFGVLVRVAGSVRRKGAGGYQPGFIGEDHGLDPVAQPELGEYPADMNLHGALSPYRLVKPSISIMCVPFLSRC